MLGCFRFFLDGRVSLFPTFRPLATWLRICLLDALLMALLLSMNSNSIALQSLRLAAFCCCCFIELLLLNF